MASHIDTKLWFSKEMDAELLCGCFGDFSYETHTHDTACLALITRGSIRIRMKGAEFVANAGDLYAIDADEVHAGWPVDEAGWSQRTIYVDLSVLRERLAGQKAPTPALRGPIIRDRRLSQPFLAAHRASEDLNSSLQRDEHFLLFGFELLSRHVTEHPLTTRRHQETRAVQMARAFLDSRLDANVSLSEIARAAQLPPFQFYRAFERETGLTPHSYQRQARIRSAITLIRQGMPLAGVAAASGFADQAHMTRNFRARMGITPGAYRQARLST